MKAIAAAMTLSLLSIPALADTYICKEEQKSFMELYQDRAKDVVAGTASNSYIVSEKGVKFLGSKDEPIIDSCEADVNGALFLCEKHTSESRVSPEISDWLRINNAGGFTFIMHMYDSRGATETHIVSMGKCSKI